ncbi:VOC family protein [Agarivorans sp. QJM3NY_25]
MQNLDIIEIKSFVPAKNFEDSKRFYQAIGFELASDFDGIAYFRKGACSFLLQDFYESAHCQNFMMHLLVEDAASWREHIIKSEVSSAFSVSLSELVSQPWGMLEFCLTDPSGVLWRIAQNQ